MLKQSRFLEVLFVSSSFFLLCSFALAGELTLNVDGQQREALVFAPANHEGKLPVVFVFHGHGGHIKGESKHMGFQEAWPEAIVVYLQGLPTTSKHDLKGLQPGWQNKLGEYGDRDLKFFDKMLAVLHEKYPVDDKRIFVSGFSNGAFFSYLLWAQRGATIAALAPCAGRLAPDGDPLPNISTPRPILHIAGEKDQVVPFEKQKETIAEDRRIDSANAGEEPCSKGCTRYKSSKGTPVLFIVHPGGHEFPSWATERIVTFFKNHPAS